MHVQKEWERVNKKATEYNMHVHNKECKIQNFTNVGFFYFIILFIALDYFVHEYIYLQYNFQIGFLS